MSWDPYQEPLQPGLTPTANLLGPLSLVQAPSGQLVSTDQAKKYLRVDLALDDDLIGEQIESATDYCEKQIPGHRQFRTAVFDLPVAGWWCGELRLPRPPLQSVASVKYFDADGNEQTLASSDYRVRTPWRAPGTVEWTADFSEPLLDADRSYPVTIRFTAGYVAANVPSPVKQAIRFLVSQWYTHRVPVGAVTQEMANTVTALLGSEDWGSYQ